MDLTLDIVHLRAELSREFSFDPNLRIWNRTDDAPFAYSDGDESEEYLLRVLRGATDLRVGSLELERAIRDFPSRYHLSGDRANLLRPLRAMLRGRVLEIGAGCGALTRFLGENGATVLAVEGSERRAAICRSRCRDLDNVEVARADVTRYLPSMQFDAVLLVGVLEYARQYSPDPLACVHLLRWCANVLGPDGALVVAIENRLGLKYLAGAPEDHLGVPFAGIHDAYDTRGPATFGRAELERLLAEAGLATPEFAFPFPDYKFPRVVVSPTLFRDHPEAAVNLIAPQAARDQAVRYARTFSEECAWPTAIRNGLGPDLANSFLVITGKRLSPGGLSALACVYASGWRRCFQKEVALHADHAGGLAVRRTRLYPDDPQPPGPFEQRVDPEPFVAGPLAGLGVYRIVNRERWTVSDLAAWARPWVDFLVGESRCEHGETPTGEPLLGAAFVDCTPFNLVETPAGMVPIDLEWISTAPVSLGHVVFRGLLGTLLRIRSTARPGDQAINTSAALIEAVMRQLGLDADRARLEAWADDEATLQRWVTGRDVDSSLLLSGLPPIRVEGGSGDLAELERLRHDVERLAAWGRSASRDVEIRDQEIVRLGAELQRISDWGRDVTTRLEAAHVELASARARQVQLEAEWRAVQQSHSWRVTAPLRSARRAWEKLRARRLASPLRPPAAVAAEPASAPAGSVQQQRRASPAPSGVTFPAESCFDDVFVWSVIDWHFRIQRPQHLARQLASSGRRVFFVSSQFVDAAEPGCVVESLDPGSDRGELYLVRLQVAGAPLIYFGAPSRPVIDQIRSALAGLLAASRSRRPLLLIEHPFWLPIVEVFPNARLVYDCMDHHDGFGNNSPDVVALERQLLERAELVVVTSRWLETMARESNRHVIRVPNGCEYEHFAARPPEVFRDPDGRKVVGYYGAIAEWFDLDLVARLAEACPASLILLVGADTAGAARVLRQHANLKMTGEVAYERLPYYLHGFDVCILPFKVVPLTLATNPVKVYEYLSAGKPVVSVDLPEVEALGDVVSRAASPGEFVDRVRAVLAGTEPPSAVEHRRGFASLNTWGARARQLRQAFSEISEPLVSVVVVTFNNLALTRACLQSLEAFSDWSNYEVIVVDNASNDGSPEFIRGFCDQRPGWTFVGNNENRGFAAANNQGLELARGEYLVLLNNDTVVTEGWMGTLVRHLKRDPRIGLIGPVTNNIGNEARIETSYQTVAEMHGEARRRTLDHMGLLFDIRTLAFFCVMMPRAVYDEVGPLDEAFGIGLFEDDDYCRRIEQTGRRLVCAEDVFVHHHLSASLNTLGDERRQRLFEENRRFYEGKWGTWIPHSYRE